MSYQRARSREHRLLDLAFVLDSLNTTIQACYRDEELVYRAREEYKELTRRKPVHLIFGDEPDIR